MLATGNSQQMISAARPHARPRMLFGFSQNKRDFRGLASFFQYYMRRMYRFTSASAEADHGRRRQWAATEAKRAANSRHATAFFDIIARCQRRDDCTARDASLTTRYFDFSR